MRIMTTKTCQICFTYQTPHALTTYCRRCQMWIEWLEGRWS